MAEYSPTIGLEIHAELKTRTKMFCDSLNDPDEKHPNINICPVCLAHPGTLPTINKQAVKNILKIGLALGAELSDESRFDRKNYFYPDIPKGYQISQYQYPLVKTGVLVLPSSGKKVRITRVHLEEDTARSIHNPKTGHTLVDFNRAGMPLMELVTEPDMKAASEAREFAEELQLILKSLGVSDADMEKGQMRVEANISIAQLGGETAKLGTKVEVKNINSFRAVERAIEYEIKRQAQALEVGEKVRLETRGWDDVKGETVPQRSKEEAHDYKYFPEPDLPPMKISEVPEFSHNVLKSELPELPSRKRERFVKEYGISGAKLEFFIRDKAISEFFEKAASETQRWAPDMSKEKLVSLLVNYISSDLAGLLGARGLSVSEIRITPENFAELVKMTAKGEVSSRGIKDLIALMLETGGDPSELAAKEGFLIVGDTGAVEEIVKKVISENTKAVEDFRKGREGSLKFLVGQAMREAKSRKIGANPQTLEELFKKFLA